MLPFFLWLLLIQYSIASQPVTSQQQQQPPQNIIILAGQSNMAGRGGVTNDTKTGKLTWDRVIPVQSQPNPSILRLSANLTWVLAHEPLHVDIDYNKTNGVGPGMPFANAVLTKDPGFGVIGLVPCAIGGTNISEWGKGGFLYEQMVSRTEVALQVGGSVLKGMLWYQGESDTIVKEDADAYQANLEKLFFDVRSDLLYPSLPIIQVALASAEGPYIETVREAQLGINLPNVRCVDAKGLPLKSDRLHLSTPAQPSPLIHEFLSFCRICATRLYSYIKLVKGVFKLRFRWRRQQTASTATSSLFLASSIELKHGELSFQNGDSAYLAHEAMKHWEAAYIVVRALNLLCFGRHV